MVTFTKKALQKNCATNECDSDSKKWCFLLTRKWWLPKDVSHKQECD
jgi:hypothetical protein